MVTESWSLDDTSGPPHVDGAFIDHLGSRWSLEPASSTPLQPVHISVGPGCPLGPSEGDKATNHTQSPLLQLPIKVVKSRPGLRAKGTGTVTAASLAGADYTGWYPGGFDHISGTYAYNLTYGPTPKKLLDYSLSGVCGKVKGSTGERCYIMLGGATIRAIKHHEKSFAGVVAVASQKALGHAARKVAVNYAKNKVKSELISFAIKKLAGSTVATGFGGFSFGQMLGKILTAAVIAQRWDDLEEPGFPHKCFVFQATYDKGKTKLGLDPIWSFVRSWDAAHPPSRPRSTSFAHWDAPGDVAAALPLFCSGAGAKATVTGPSSGLDELLAPPYVRFSVDFNH